MLGRVSQRAAAGRLAVEKEGGLRTLMRSMSLIPAKRRLRVVTALPEVDGSFLSDPTALEEVGQLSAAPSTLPSAEPPTLPSTQPPTTLTHRTKKKSLRIVSREPKSTLTHHYKFSPSITPPAPLVAIENAVLSKNYTEAIAAFHNVPRDDRNRFAYEWVMQAHMGLRQYADVVRLFEEAEKCVPMLHSRIRYLYIVALNRQSRFADALDAFVDWHMGDVAPLTLVIYNALLVACSHVRDWNAAKTIMDAMTSKAHVNPDGPSYFYLMSTAVKCRHEVPPLTALSIAESAAAAGFPISVSLLGHILLDAAQVPSPSSASTPPVPTARRVAALRRALDLWDDNKQYDAFTPACEKPYEFALLGMWDVGLHSEAVQVIEDLIALPTPSRAFKFRVANMLLTKAAPVNADMSIKLLDLMVDHRLGRLSGPARFRLYAGWTDLLEIEDIAAFFKEYEAVTHGWNGARLSDLFIFGYRRFHDKGGKTTVEFKRVMELFTFAFQSGETLTYPALEHAVRWLYEMGKANEALQIIQTMLANPDLPVGYRLTELGMFIATRLGDPDTVIALFEDLQARWQADKGVELNPKRFVIRMAAKAYSDTDNLIKFQEMRYILTNNEFKHWEGDEIPKHLRRGGMQYI